MINCFNIDLIAISGSFTNLGTQRALAYPWIVSPSFLTSPSESGQACALAHPRRFFYTSLTFLTCPGGLCNAGITDEIFVTWYSITKLSSIHTATARTKPCLLTASDVRHLGWANERVSPSSFAPVYAAPNCLSRLKTRALPKGSVWLVKPEAAQVWRVVWTAYSSTYW